MKVLKVIYECDKGVMKFNFVLEVDDKTSYTIQQNSYKRRATVSLWRRTCEIHLPQDWTLHSAHPDLLALAAVSIIYPFIGSKITLSKGVSNDFHNTFKKVTGKEILPIDPKLKPRKARADSVPALAYSGGVQNTMGIIQQ